MIDDFVNKGIINSYKLIAGKERFEKDNYLFKLDCLQDWIDLLEVEYRKTWEEYGKGLKKLIKKEDK